MKSNDSVVKYYYVFEYKVQDISRCKVQEGYENGNFFVRTLLKYINVRKD